MNIRVLTAVASLAGGVVAASDTRIDRRALVARHHPVVERYDPDASLTVGNGRFAFTADVTGLQTFADRSHGEGVPTETLARWAWHSEPNPRGFRLADANRPYVQADGRTVAYPTDGGSEAGQWLRRNPHDLPLGQIAFETDEGLGPDDIRVNRQTLHLMRGVIDSQFAIGRDAVRVTTSVHPDLDLVAVNVQSWLVDKGRLRVRLAFPRGHDLAVKNTPALDWSRPDEHRTTIVRRRPGRVDLLRAVDDARYHVSIAWKGDAELRETAPHRLTLVGRGRTLSFVVGFAPGELPERLPSADATRSASAAAWTRFWHSGAAVDFQGSTDPRASELERRLVLSQYLTAVQVGGELPPQESGLTCSTWYGKHHTEMMWWHTAHFALWGRPQRLARQLDWYAKRLPVGREIARERGLRGARWPKMVGPEGRESPGGNPLIVWNQPHPIALAELLYRADPSAATLARWRDLVLETADGLASMLHLERGRYVLGPPLWIAQEIYDQRTSQNPSFELSYWRTALKTAQAWRERLDLPRSPGWDDVLARLSPLPVKNGRYVALESHPDTFDHVASRHDHPTMVAPLGLLPGDGVDRATMERTLDSVLETWDWEMKTWGWDYPMIAMTAARLGRPDKAVEILLRDGPNNRYLPNGHCPQRSDEAGLKPRAPGAPRHEIAVYLPANGALLSAAALMIGGWDGASTGHPGIPKDGRWTIRAEGLRPLP